MLAGFGGFLSGSVLGGTKAGLDSRAGTRSQKAQADATWAEIDLVDFLQRKYNDGIKTPVMEGGQNTQNDTETGDAFSPKALDESEDPKNTTGNLKPGTLRSVDARKWYLAQESKIPDLIDRNSPLEEQAKQAFDLRNQYRTQARELMSDRSLAESLYQTDPNLTWEQVIQKQIAKGLSGDEIYEAIIESSQRSRKSVNQSLGLE